MPGMTLTTPAKRAIGAQGRQLKWLAERLGVTQQHLSRQLDGTRRISLAQATRLSELTGLPEYLFLDAVRDAQRAMEREPVEAA